MRYSLTDRQKEMLRSIVPGLQDGTVKTEWKVYFFGEGVAVDGLEDDLLNNQWADIKEADFDDFVEATLFRWKGQGSYTLNTQQSLM